MLKSGHLSLRLLNSGLKSLFDIDIIRRGCFAKNSFVFFSEDKMPCVIFVKSNSELKIVKSEWVQNVNKAESRTVGTPPNVVVKVFHSHNPKQKSNFDLEVVSEFDFKQNVCFCYEAYVLTICGKYNSSFQLELVQIVEIYCTMFFHNRNVRAGKIICGEKT